MYQDFLVSAPETEYEKEQASLFLQEMESKKHTAIDGWFHEEVESNPSFAMDVGNMTLEDFSRGMNIFTQKILDGEIKNKHIIPIGHAWALKQYEDHSPDFVVTDHVIQCALFGDIRYVSF